jgi:hypothetical protein
MTVVPKVSNTMENIARDRTSRAPAVAARLPALESAVRQLFAQWKEEFEGEIDPITQVPYVDILPAFIRDARRGFKVTLYNAHYIEFLLRADGLLAFGSSLNDGKDAVLFDMITEDSQGGLWLSNDDAERRARYRSEHLEPLIVAFIEQARYLPDYDPLKTDAV